jgi:hypothetical protein
MASLRKAQQPVGSAYSPPGERVGRGMLISCARATRGRGLPSLDTRSGRPSSRPSREKVGRSWLRFISLECFHFRRNRVDFS